MPPPLLFLLFLPLTLASNQTCPIVLPQPSQPRIIGGTAAIPSTRSFLVSLSNASDVFACTGSLLSSRWVLTAAHCKVKTDWKVRIAPERATSGPTIAITNVFVHDQYPDNPDRPDGPGDISLVQLAEDAPSEASFVRLNVNATVPVPGAFARSAGYGRTRKPGQDRGNSLPFQVDGPVNSPVKCGKIYKGYLNVRKELFICVGYGKGFCVADSCHGDSGGPLLLYDDQNRPVQVGIVSFGLECGVQGVPGVHVRVSSFVDWMEKMGAEFETSNSAITVFDQGSEEAASETASITVLQLLGEEEKEEDSSQLTISKVTFAVICVIAGLALIGFIFLALYFVSGRRESSTGSVELSLPPLQVNFPPGSERQSPGPNAEQQVGGQQAQDNLQLAISLLQAITYEQARGGGSPPVGDSRENTPASGNIVTRQRSIPSSGSMYLSAKGFPLS